MRIDQVVNSYSSHDAVGNHVFLLQKISQSLVGSSQIFAEQNLSQQDSILPLDAYDCQNNRKNILIYHHSIGTSIPLFLSKVKAFKILIYHNVTPSRFFSGPQGDAFFEEACKEGVRQLALLKLFCDLYWTVSAYNKVELENCGFSPVEVLPILRDYRKISGLAEKPFFNLDDRPFFIFVGRLTPHKGQDDLIELLAVMKNLRPRLFLVGGNLPVYKAWLLEEAKRLDLRTHVGADFASETDLVILENLDDQSLSFLYKHALAFVCLSKHEGFCVPVAEAAHCGLGTLSLAHGALAETVKQYGGVVCAHKDDLKGKLLNLLKNKKRLLPDPSSDFGKETFAQMAKVYEDRLRLVCTSLNLT